MRKALYVAFAISPGKHDGGTVRVVGELLKQGEKVAQAQTTLVRERNGNLVFDLPDELSDGPYIIQIDASGNQGGFAAHGSLAVQRADFQKYQGFQSTTLISVHSEVVFPRDTFVVNPSDNDKAAGYVVFSRSPLTYVFPGTKPKRAETIHAVSVRAVRNEYTSESISLYPLRRLGNVKIEISDLQGRAGRIGKDKINIGHVESVKDTLGLPAGHYRNLPTLIRPGNQVDVEKGADCRFWLTFKIDTVVQQGIYRGSITIMPQYGKNRSLPLQVVVDPVVLEDIPNKDYFMFMTYEFTELTMPWNKEERHALYRSACNILKSYKEHGMTTIAIHSPFVLIKHEDGTPVLDDIFAALVAARDQGFTRPIVWYMGHLIQTAKPKHPGNILGFDENVESARLHEIVKTVLDFSEKNHCPPVIFLPIDEPDDLYQDYHGKRRSVTPLLLGIIHDAGGKTMLTARGFSQFKPVDYLCSSEVNERELGAAHQAGSAYWAYNDRVTTHCENPAYARYIYGYYTWKSNVDGMTSWTFQNTQNASGLPTKADGPGDDLYLAYPDPDGPLATLKWEAVREGIDDHKLIYQLTKRIAQLKQKGIGTARYEKYLSGIREKQGEPACHLEDTSTWDNAYFEQTRAALIALLKDAARLNALTSARSVH